MIPWALLIPMVKAVWERAQRQSPESITVTEEIPNGNQGFLLGQGLGREVRWDPERLPNPHFLAVGGSGAGKSQTLKALIYELKRALPWGLILDLHGDLAVAGVETLPLHYRSPWGLSLFAFPKDERAGGPNGAIEVIRSRLKRAFPPMGSYQQGVLTELLHTAYQIKGITQNPRTWKKPLPTFQDLWALLEEQEEAAKAMARESLASLHVKFRPLAVSGLFSREQLIPLPPKGWVRVDLSGLPHELQYLAVDVLLRQLFWTMLLAGETSTLRGAIILDEAKLILAKSKSDPLAILSRLASEGRKFGLMVLLAAQDLRHFSTDILDNVAAKLVLMHAETAIRSTASKLLLGEGTLLSLKQPFEGYVRQGGRGWEPVTIMPYYARAT